MKISKYITLFFSFFLLCSALSPIHQKLKEEPKKTTHFALSISKDQKAINTIDLETGLSGRSIPLEKNPTGIAISENLQRAFCLLEDSTEILTLDLETGSLLEPLILPFVPKQLVISENQNLGYFISYETKEINAFNLETGFKKNTFLLDEAPSRIALSFDEKILFVAFNGSSTITPIDLVKEEVMNNIALEEEPHSFNLTKDGHLATFRSPGSSTELTFFDLQTGSLDHSLDLSYNLSESFHFPENIETIEFAKDGKRAYLTHENSNKITPVDLQDESIEDLIESDQKVQNLAIIEKKKTRSILFIDKAAPTDPSSTTVTSNINPAIFGQLVTFTATVSSTDPGTPTGTVTFFDNTTNLGTSTLVGGVAQFSISTLSVGSHPITASYSGDNTFLPSDSSLSPVLEVENPGTTSTALNSSLNPSLTGQNVTFTATITETTGNGTPTGIVTFLDGMSSIGTGTVAGGVATLTTSSLSVATHSITAVYGGDVNFGGSTSPVLTQTVNPGTVTVGLSSSLNPSNFGSSVTFQATLTVATGIGTPTGNVTFFDGATNLGTVSLTGLTASFSTSALTIGSHSITAVYNADSNFSTATSSPLSQVVNEAISTTNLTSSVNPSAFGQNITFTATVSSTAPGTPTGTVTFTDGVTTIGSGTLSGGVATFSTSALSVASHSITASYGGDAVFLSSASTPLTQVVNQGLTSTSLVSSLNPSRTGQSITFTATVAVTTGAGTPTGTVNFLDGTTVIGSGTLSGNVANFAISSLSVGSHTITAAYVGDTNFQGSTSAATTQTVNQGTVSVTVTSSANPSVFGNNVTLTATLTVTGGNGTPTGTVTFKDGATTIGTGNLSSGVATFTTSALAVGSHSITAVYAGNTNFATATSAVFTQNVNQGTTNTTVSSSVNPSTYGQSITFTSTTTVATGAGSPSGSVTFLDGTTVLGTSPISVGGTATYTTFTLTVATHPITAVYSGDTNFITSTSPILNQIVGKATPLITLTSSSNPSPFGGSITFTSTVSAPTTLGLPSGTLSFYDGATLLGTGNLIPSGANTATTSFTLTNLTAGSHTITAIYSGDGNFLMVTSSPLTQVVGQVVTTTTDIFSTSPNPSEYGQTITLNARVTGSTFAAPFPPTGTVNFYEGTTLLGTGTLSPIGLNVSQATLNVSSLIVGSHSLTAQYLGDNNYPGSTSNPMIQVVIQTGTTTVVTSSSNPSVFGQNVTFSAAVSGVAPGQGNATGTVLFYDGVTLLGSGTLSPTSADVSTATFSTSALPLGANSIYAIYNGDTNFTSSTSPKINQQVNQDTTTTLLTSSVNPSNFGQSITLTATPTANTPGSGTPTGTVSFYDGTTLLQTVTLTAGVATYSTIALYPGSHSLKAVYSGDTDFITSTSSIVTQVVVNQLPTVTTITSSRNSSPINNAVTYSAKVSAITGTPTGTVTFYDLTVSSSPLGTGTLVNGIATLTESGANLSTLGTHQIEAVYGGDANFITSTSAIFNQYVVPIDTSVVLTTNPNPSTQSDATLTATVSIGSGSGPLTGTVNFYEDGVLIPGTVNFNQTTGVATLMPNNLHFGYHNITAIYSGDQTTFAMATSNTVVQLVQETQQLLTRTVLTTSLSTAYYCQPITLTATVSEQQGFYIPTGTVTFYSNDVAIGGAILNNLGVATLTIATLPVGTLRLTASYNSDSNYAFSFSNTLQVIIQANPTTGTITTIPNLTSTPYGQDISFSVAISSAYGTPTGSVTFYDGTTLMTTTDLDATGQATYETSTLSVGSHSINAVYNADPCFVTTTVSVNHTVTKINPVPILSSSPNPSIYGDPILITANLTSTTLAVPTGSVTFYNGTTVLGTTQLVNGTATFIATNIAAGTALFKATYSGDQTFIATNFPSVLQRITQATTSTCLNTYSPNPSIYGDLITFNASVSSDAETPTGTVVFKNGSTILGTISLSGCETATLNTSNLNLGSNSITATYSGDTNFQTSSSTVLVQNIIQASTDTFVVSSTPNPSVYGTLVTFNIEVQNAGSGSQVPTGTISGYFGSTLLQTATLTNGLATITTSILPVGVNTILFDYSGDTNFTSSNAIATQTVTALSTTATLTSSNNPSVSGQPVTFSVGVTSTAGIPTGTVAFLDGTTTLATATLNSSGQASFTISTLSQATHSITAVYSGSANLAKSTSNTISQVVNKAVTTVTLTSSRNPSFYGEGVNYTAFVAATSPGSGVPTGTVTFKNGTTTLGTGTVNSSGIAVFSISSLLASTTTYPITAVYSGDVNFFTSTSATLNQLVNKSATITTATITPSPVTLGGTATLTVTVRAVNIQSGVPTGTVTAYNGSTIVGTATLNGSGQATFSTASLPAGVVNLVIQYAGDTNYLISTTVAGETVNQNSTTTALTSSVNPSSTNQSVTFTATVTPTSGVATGYISFFDGTTSIGTVTLNSSGVATLTTSSLNVGSHTIKAVYSGDSSNGVSTSSNLTQVVNTASTVTLVTGNPNPSQYGGNVTFRALVTPTFIGAAIPTGTVTFKNGATTLGVVNLDFNGQATFPTSALLAGTNLITAVYSGDSNFKTSTSSNLSQVVNLTDTNIDVTGSPNPSNYGSPVIYNIQVSGVNTTGLYPTGTLNAYFGSTLLGTATLNTTGGATITTSAIPAGTHGIMFSYFGDTNFNPSTTTLSQTVNSGTSTTVLTSSINPSKIGQATTLTATVTASSGVASGTVIFFDGTTSIGSANLVSGVATISTSSLAVGTHSITAVYQGASSITGSTSSALSQVVSKGSTTSTLTSSLNPAVFGGSVTFSAQIAAISPANGTPTGSVSFYSGASLLGTANLGSTGLATFTTMSLPTGTSNITAVYSGDTNFLTSTSPILAQVVNLANTTTTIVSGTPNPSMLSQQVSFFATVTGNGQVNATGTLSFYDGATLLGTATLSNGTAIYSTSILTLGTHSITAVYGGNSSYNSSTSPIYSQVVNQNTVTTTTVTTLTSSLNPSNSGQAVTFNVSVAPIAGSGTPTGTVTLYSGSTPLSTITLVAGAGSFTTSSLPVGSSTIVAFYSGDATYNSSTTTLIQVVDAIAINTTTVVFSTPNPSEFGNPVTFRALVTPLSVSSSNPTGTITFKNGTTTIGTGTVDINGEAIFTTSSLPIGSNGIIAVYSGDSNFVTSTSTALTQVVNKTDTKISVTSTPNPSNFGSSVTFNVAVSPINTTGVTPTGTVSAYYGSTLLGTATLNGSGTTTISTSSLSAGTLGIMFDYSGDSDFNASTTTYSQTVQNATSTTSLTSSANPSNIGEAVTLTATVVTTSGSPAGTVTFYDGSTAIGIGNLNGSGVATFGTSSLNVGTHSITAVYQGSTSITGSTSSALIQVVAQGSTSTTLISSLNPSIFGNNVTFSAQVAAVSTASGTPSGSVSFYSGATLLGTANLGNTGLATFSTTALPTGTHNITAVYSGDTSFSISTSSIVAQVVDLANSTTTIVSASPNPSMLNQQISFFATVGGNGQTNPTGTVSFFDGATLLGTANLSDGIAIFSTSMLNVGTHSITAVYGGDNDYNGFTSPIYSQVVDQNTVTTSTVTTLTSSLNPSNSGDSVTFTVSVAPIAGIGTPTGTVTLYSGSTPLSTITLVAGAGSFTTSSLPVGSSNIVALYSGDTTYSSSTTTLVQVVDAIPINTTTTLSSIPNPSEFGNPVTFRALVTPLSISSSSITGTVTFKNGTTIIGTGTVDINGEAIFATSSLAIGSNGIIAVYSGDSNFLTSTSSVLTQIVNKTDTKISVTSTANPSNFGSSVSFNVAVSPINTTGVTPTGTVSAYYGSTLVGTATLNGSGNATISTSSLPAGILGIMFDYSGDSNFNASTTTFSQTVLSATSTVALTSSVNPSNVGEGVTFTATIMASSGTPTGSVTFYDGSNVIGVGTINGSGVATITVSNLTAGSHPIQAQFSGSISISPANSSILTQQVNASGTATSLSSSLNPAVFDNTITFTATVAAVTPGSGVPTGTVSFYDGATLLGSGNVNSVGVATFSTTAEPVGTHSITAIYNGDSSFTTSTSAVLSQVVTKAPTTTTLLSSTPNPSMFGQNVTFFANVTTSVAASPTGTVSFYDGLSLLGTVPLIDGNSIFSTNTLSIGTHTVTAIYSGDANFITSTTLTPLSQVVNQTSITVTTVTTLTSNLNPSNYGDAVTFDVTISPIAGVGIPTGVVTIYLGSTPLTTLNLVNAQASYTTSTLPAGNLNIVALYSGDSEFSASTATIIQVVNPIGTTTLLTSSQNPSQFTTSVTLTATVTATNGAIPTGSISFFNGAVIIGNVLLENTGTASLATSTLPTGSNSITAVYNPNANFATSNGALTQVVNPADTTTLILTGNPNPSRQGENVTFIATTISGLSNVSGTMTFYDGANPIGTAVLYNGLAIFSTSSLNVGSHSITASFGGNSNFSPSTSAPYTQVVQPTTFSTSTILSSSINPSKVGEAVTFTATINSPSGTPTGTVTFFDGGTAIGTEILTGSGSANLTVSNLSSGSHSITAIYSGDANFASSSSAVLNQIVGASNIGNAPEHFQGCQQINRYLNSSRIKNQLTWSPPLGGATPLSYRIYRNAALTDFVAQVPANQLFYNDLKVKKNRSYSYYIVAVTAGGISPAAMTTVYPNNQRCRPIRSDFNLLLERKTDIIID